MSRDFTNHRVSCLRRTIFPSILFTCERFTVRVHRSLCRVCPGCHRVMKVSHQLSPLASRTDIVTIDQRASLAGASGRTSPSGDVVRDPTGNRSPSVAPFPTTMGPWQNHTMDGVDCTLPTPLPLIPALISNVCGATALECPAPKPEVGRTPALSSGLPHSPVVAELCRVGGVTEESVI